MWLQLFMRGDHLQEDPTIIFEWENFGVLDEWLIMAVMGCGHTRRFDSMLYNR